MFNSVDFEKRRKQAARKAVYLAFEKFRTPVLSRMYRSMSENPDKVCLSGAICEYDYPSGSPKEVRF